MASKFASCHEQELESEDTESVFSVTSSDGEGGGRNLPGRRTPAGCSANNGERMNFGRRYASRISYGRGEAFRGFTLRNTAGRGSENTQLSLEFSREDASRVFSRRGGAVLESSPRNWIDGDSPVTESRVSRALLQQSDNTSSCPLDFQFMRDFPWYTQTCEHPDTMDTNGNYVCCTALTSALGQAESQYLRTKGEFRLKDVSTVASCLESLEGELQRENSGLDTNLIFSRCFPESNYSRYASHTYNCKGIETRADFERKVGLSEITTLNSSCSPSLVNNEQCMICVVAMESVISTLNSDSSNNSDCIIYTLFYAAGISNVDGPYSPETASCILAVTIAPEPVAGQSKALALHIFIGAVAALAASLIACAFFFLWWKRRKDAVHRDFIERHTRLLKPAMMRPNTGLIEYSFEEIKAATNSFSSKNYIGSGGFGDVYRGVLDDGLEVAVKRMKNCSLDGDAEFVNEVNVINSVRHRNLVILRGCCVTSTDTDGHQRLLVYDFMRNGSLHDYLLQSATIADKPVLTWPDRRRLAIGMAKGITYLHNDARPPIIHRDIKASNVLLDEKLDAKVADFGLAKFSIEGQTTTAPAGTLGYVAPEYALYGQLTEKSDVYSFGVVLLELLSGRNALDSFDGNYSLITDWAWAKVKEGNVLDTVDERIRKAGPRDVMKRFVLVGILCSHMLVAFRPTMEEALKYLEGDVPLPHLQNRPLPVNQALSSDAVAPSQSPPVNAAARYPPPPGNVAGGSPPPPGNRATPSRPPPENVAASPPPPPVNVADDAPSDDESESARLYRAHRIAMSHFSGPSAGVLSAELLR